MTTLTQEKQQTNTKRLAGKVALVTGGSRGIGKDIALRLAEEGAIVAITYAKSKDAALDVQKQIEALGTTGYAFQADAASHEEALKVIAELKKSNGKIDILVNNAGVFEGAPLEDVTLDQYDRVFNVNVRGIVATTLAALPLIPDGGRIINISSVVATRVFAGASIYSATKAAVNSLTRTWAQDLGNRRISVTAVSPGTTETDMLNSGIPAEVQSQMIEKTALGRLGKGRDIANVVLFLASEDGAWVTGQAIEADGGLTVG